MSPPTGPVTLDEVFAAFADEVAAAMPAPEGATAAEIAAYEAALGAPLPAEYRRFCERVGRAPGPFAFRGAHVGLDVNLTRVTAAWEAKRARRKRKGETGPPPLVCCALPVGTCEDCGPAYLDPVGDAIPRSVRARCRPPSPAAPAVLQIDSWKGDRTEGTLLAESLAAWVFGDAFGRSRASRSGPLRLVHVTPPPGPAVAGFGDVLADALAPLGYARHPQSRFALAWYLVHRDGRGAVAISPDPRAEPPLLACRVSGDPRRADATLDLLATIARVDR